MLHSLMPSVLLACLCVTSSVHAKEPVVNLAPGSPGFSSSLIAVPANADGTPSRPFQAHYNFPMSAPDMDQQDWMKLDPRNPAERKAYYDAILKYGLSAFQADIRDGCPRFSDEWYHMPWMTVSFGASPSSIADGRVGPGREPLCGLTQERTAPEKFLHPRQERRVQNWAVGTFNATGANLLGQIWKDKNSMDLSRTTFSNGTFIVKFLFTEATAKEVPYLLGAPQWEAYIYTSEADPKKRDTRTMLLAQIDFGVRDARADSETGWVYGTFLYFNPSTTSPADWKANLVPVGLMWGNDPGITTAGAFREQALNPAVAQLRDSGMIFDTATRPVFGWHDRVNGPIDNPKSACLSCHATAQVHKTLPIKHFLTFDALKPANATDANKMLWFRNIKAGQPFTFSESELKMLNQGAPTSARADWTPALMGDFISTDYSIQLRMAIENARAYSVQNALFAIKNLSPASRQLLTTSPAIKKIEHDLQKETGRIERSGLQR